MAYISENQLSQYRRQTKVFSADNIVSLNESVNRDKVKPMVFLSHKHDEFEIRQDVIAFLEKEGVDIYVDWMDESMPKNTSSETAHKLKKKIKACDKFVLVATQAAIDSKWCNWELGLGDAAKYIKNIALVPIDKTYNSFKGSEYLSIYPSIQYENGNNKYVNGNYIPAGYYVLTPSDNGKLNVTPLKVWLQSK